MRATPGDVPSILAVCAAATLFGCEDPENLYIVPEPPDTGIVDVGFPDVGFPDMGVPEVGTPDMGVPPPATESIYIHTGDTLFSYDPERHRTTRVGVFSTRSGPLEDPMVDIAIDARGVMFGGTGTARDAKRVYRIDPATADCTYLFEVDDNLNGLAFDGSGRMVAAGESLRVVDTSSGRTVLTFAEAGERFTTSGDVVGLPDGNIYWTVRGLDRGDPDQLVRLDPNSGRPTLLGTLSRNNLFGLGYANEKLYGFTDQGEVVVIDPTNGRVLENRSLEGRWFGATANPVTW